MGLDHHKSMKKRVVIGFFLLLLINFSLDLSIDCKSSPEFQENIREWTLLNNKSNSINIEVQESRNISIQYYIEEIEEIDQMRYIVNLNFTGDTLLIYGNVNKDLVRIYTIFCISLFAGDTTDYYYELQMLNETIFTIPDYIYNFSWNFTSTDPLQFLNLRFYTQYESTDYASIYNYSGETWTLIQDSQVFQKDSFKNLSTKIKFNINSQQFITNINVSIDYSNFNHTSVNLINNEIICGDDSNALTYLSGYMTFQNREQNLLDNNGWIQEFSYSYSSIYYIQIPKHQIFGSNSQNSLQLNSNEEISNQTDKIRISFGISPLVKVESPLIQWGDFYYYQVSLGESLYFELDNISSSKEFFQRYSRIFIFTGMILGISGLVILTKLYQKRRNLR